MAFQPETNTWSSGVYQWETTDPAQGGVGGVMNTPLLQLSNRTLWLKGQVETLASSISGSAPLNSPAFIGNPTGPLAPQFDNDTSLAVTAFVQRALGNFSGYDVYWTSATLSVSQAGRQILYSGAAGTFALPAVSGLVAGAGYWISNVGNSTLTIQLNGTDTFLGVSGATSIVLGPNDNLYVVSAGGGGQWVVFGGSAQLQYSTVLGNKANTSGSYPGLNVGYATSSGNADTVDGWHRDDIRAWGNLLNKPTTLSGYGITDALPISGGMASGPIGASSASEAQLQVSMTGQPLAYLYSSAAGWGLYSSAGGGIVNYTRADEKIRVGGVDTSLIVQNSGGTYGINITGNANTVGGYQASGLWRNDAVSFSASPFGYFQFPPDASGRRLILQWGKNASTTLGNTYISFPIAFPNACVGVQNTGITSGGYSGDDNNIVVSGVTESGFTCRTDNGLGTYWFAYGY